jgi:hypothetical protein
VLHRTAHLCEAFALAACTFTLYAVPFSTQLYQFPITSTTADLPRIARRRNQGSVKEGVDSRSTWTGYLIFGGFIGTAVLVTGNALVANAFGMAWARAVAGEDNLGWEPGTIALSVYDMARASLFSVITAGMVLAAVQARWLINGVACDMILIFSAWVVFAVAAFLPLVLIFTTQYFMDQDKAKEECVVFNTGGSDFDKNVCEIKWFGMIIGTGILAFTVIFQTILGYVGYIPGICSNPQVGEMSETALEAAAPALEEVGSGSHLGGGGYRSKDQSFFNFSTKLDPEAARKLLQPSPPRERPYGSFPQMTRAQLPAFNLNGLNARVGVSRR